MPDRGFYRAHLENDVLGWWLGHGPDAEYGGVRTCFANTGGALVSTDKYTWSQGRWAWLTARLASAARRGLLGLDAAVLLRESQRAAEVVPAARRRHGPAVRAGRRPARQRVR